MDYDRDRRGKPFVVYVELVGAPIWYYHGKREAGHNYNSTSSTIPRSRVSVTTSVTFLTNLVSVAQMKCTWLATTSDAKILQNGERSSHITAYGSCMGE